MILFLLPKSPKFYVLLYVLLICYYLCKSWRANSLSWLIFIVCGTGTWVLVLVLCISYMLLSLDVLVKTEFMVVSLFWFAVLILLVYRNCLRKHCGPVDQKALEVSTISHQVTQRAWCRVLGSTSLPSKPAHVRTTHKATCGLVEILSIHTL